MTEDRRVKRTKAALRASLLEKLQEKPIGRVTVKELCDAAGINRGTFYSHYSSPEDLMRTLMRDFEAELLAQMKEFDNQDSVPQMLPAVTRMLEFIEDNRGLCEAVLRCGVDNPCLSQVMQHIRQEYAPTWLEGKTLPDVRMEMVYTYIVNGCIGVIKRWLSSPNPEPPETVARVLLAFSRGGVRAL